MSSWNSSIVLARFCSSMNLLSEQIVKGIPVQIHDTHFRDMHFRDMHFRNRYMHFRILDRRQF